MRDQRWDRLVAWYLAQRRSLPWRDHPTPYRVWVSEIMLQQTQVRTVLPYFLRWMKRFPTVQALSAASEDDVLAQWAGLGYYRRARNLHAAAKLIAERLKSGGGWPARHVEWLELPGIGRYTAGAICSIALGQCEPIVDGNVERVFSRLFRKNSKNWWAASRMALDKAVARKVKAGDFNQALMELGATVCTPRNPLCSVCPMRVGCEAYAQGEVEKFPKPKLRARIRKVEEHVACCLDEQGSVLLVKNQGKWRQGLWDFPLLKDVQTAQGTSVVHGEIQYAVTVHRVRRRYTLSRSKRSGFRLKKKRDTRWVDPSAPAVAVGAPVSKLLRLLIE